MSAVAGKFMVASLIGAAIILFAGRGGRRAKILWMANGRAGIVTEKA